MAWNPGSICRGLELLRQVSIWRSRLGAVESKLLSLPQEAGGLQNSTEPGAMAVGAMARAARLLLLRGALGPGPGAGRGPPAAPAFRGAGPRGRAAEAGAAGAGAGAGAVQAAAALGARPDLVERWLDPRHLARREQRALERRGVRERFARHPADTGSPEVQVAALTDRIAHLNQHRAEHHKDKHSQRGLQHCLAQRRKLLRYLKRKDFGRYADLLKELGLRDNY